MDIETDLYKRQSPEGRSLRQHGQDGTSITWKVSRLCWEVTIVFPILSQNFIEFVQGSVLVSRSFLFQAWKVVMHTEKQIEKKNPSRKNDMGHLWKRLVQPWRVTAFFMVSLPRRSTMVHVGSKVCRRNISHQSFFAGLIAIRFFISFWSLLVTVKHWIAVSSTTASPYSYDIGR